MAHSSWPVRGKNPESAAAMFNPLLVCGALHKQDFWSVLVVVAYQIGRWRVFKNGAAI